MAHKARCAIQNNAIEEIHNMVKKYITYNGNDITALMIGNYKMKFGPMSLWKQPLTITENEVSHDMAFVYNFICYTATQQRMRISITS